MLPLKDKTVLITRSADQSKEFTDQLQDLGATTILLPLIETTPINTSELINKLTTDEFDWIIFTSTNAVHYFFDAISPETINAKIAVVGKKTGDFLRELGVEIDFIPSEFTAKFLATEIPISLNDKVLIPRSNLANNDIIEILESRNCIVEIISIYKNSAIEYSQNDLEKMFNQNLDFITFTSSSTVSSFMKLGVKLNQEKVICIGPETVKTAQKANIKVTAIAEPHNIEGIIKAILLIK